MPLWLPTYDSTALFGLSVRMTTSLNPSADQVSAFFGVSGVLNLFGGLRGRVFLAEGVLWGAGLDDLNAAEALFRGPEEGGYKDGIGRVLVDTRGRVWPSVLVDRFEPGKLLNGGGRGLYLPYRAAFTGLY